MNTAVLIVAIICLTLVTITALNVYGPKRK